MNSPGASSFSGSLFLGGKKRGPRDTLLDCGKGVSFRAVMSQAPGICGSHLLVSPGPLGNLEEEGKRNI